MSFSQDIGKLGHRQGDLTVALKNGTRDTPEAILSDEGHMHVLPYVWNPNTLQFEVSTAAGAAGSVTVTNFPATQPVSLTDGADVAQGTTSDAAWVSGAGTVISLLKKIASAGGSAVSIADGADTNQGTTTDAAVVTDVAGTMSGKLRGLVKMLASVWDSVNGRLKVDGSAVTQPVSGTFWQATQPVSIAAAVAVTGPLTDTQLRATAVPVSGAFYQATQPVSGTFWQATQPVSGPLTDAQLRATAVPVSQPAATDWRSDLRRGQTILKAVINASASGDNQLVAADATKKIKVLQYTMIAAGAVNATFKSGATPISGAMPLVANSGVATPFVAPAEGELIESAATNALILNLSAAIAVTGHLTYILEA